MVESKNHPHESGGEDRGDVREVVETYLKTNKEEVDYGKMFWGESWEKTAEVLANAFWLKGLEDYLVRPASEGESPSKKRAAKVKGKGEERIIYFEDNPRALCEDRKIKLSSAGIFGVFDGVATGNGAMAAEVASRMVYGLLCKRMQGEDIPEALRNAFSQAHAVVKLLQKSPEYKLTATTASVVKICENKAYIYNAGDSRVLVWRSGNIRFRTKDDSKLRYKIQTGEVRLSEEEWHALDQFESLDGLSEQERKYIGYRTVIYDSIGTGSPRRGKGFRAEDTQVVDLLPGDRLLLVTDGVSDNLLEKEMQKILEDETDDTTAESAILNASWNRVKETLPSGERHPRAKNDDMTVVVYTVPEKKSS